MAVMKHFANFLIKHKIHFLSWILFISGEVVIIGLATGVFGDLLTYASHYLLNIVLFYLCSLWLYPKIFDKTLNWIWKLPTHLAVVFAIYLMCSYLIDNYLLKETNWYGFHEINLGRKFIFSQLWRALFFMGFSGFYFLFREHIKEIESRKETEQSHYQDIIHKRELQLQLENAKNSYLKAQINPHLLFNTLSFIYQDILSSSPKSAEVIMELSDIMRYSINCEFNEPTVPLKEELKQVKKLVGLQRKRFENEIFVDVIYKQEVAKVKFIPLVLVTLTENIFKHGMFQEPEFPATLRIEVQNNQLVISCINHPKRRTSIESMNKGLDNIRQRLAIAYGSDATINYGTNGDLFYVRITAPLSIPQPASKTE